MSQIFYDDLSWKPQIDKAEKPVYLAIAKALESDIKNEILKPGNKLPPQRELADFLHVNLTTVTKAFKLCERKGLISATVGKGTFVSSDANASYTDTIQEVRPTDAFIDMGTLHPFYEQNELVVQAVRKISQENQAGKLFEYDEPRIKRKQREMGAKWLERFHMEVEPDNVVITSGAQNGLAVTLISLFQPGDKIGTDCLTYMGFKNLANLLGMRLVPVDMGQDGMSAEILEKTCKAEELKGLYVMPECQNPTTSTMKLSTRQQIAEVVRRYGVILIEDDTYSFLQNTSFPPISSFIPEQSIYISSLSKSIGAGLRVAFLAVAPSLREPINRGIYNINLDTPNFNIGIVSNLVETGQAERIIEEKRNEAAARNKIFNEILGSFASTGNARDYFRWLALPDGWTGKEFELSAKLAGVQLFCAERFAVGSCPVPAAVRISTASVRHQSDLIKGLTIIKELLSKKPDAFPLII